MSDNTMGGEATRAASVQRGRLLEHLTVGWNSLEAIISIAAGLFGGSVALAKIGSRALKADSRQADICTYLSSILLAGLALNALFGWWWADPVAALVMIPIIVKEGVGALRGETCCDDVGCH